MRAQAGCGNLSDVGHVSVHCCERSMCKQAHVPCADSLQQPCALLKMLCNIQGMLEDMRKAPDGSVVLLHACAHNPTGAPGAAFCFTTQHVKRAFSL